MVYLEMVLMTKSYNGINLTERGINHLPYGLSKAYRMAIKYSNNELKNNKKIEFDSLVSIVNLFRTFPKKTETLFT